MLHDNEEEKIDFILQMSEKAFEFSITRREQLNTDADRCIITILAVFGIQLTIINNSHHWITVLSFILIVLALLCALIGRFYYQYIAHPCEKYYTLPQQMPSSVMENINKSTLQSIINMQISNKEEFKKTYYTIMKKRPTRNIIDNILDDNTKEYYYITLNKRGDIEEIKTNIARSYLYWHENNTHVNKNRVIIIKISGLIFFLWIISILFSHVIIK
jgi:hypothetical protein